MNDPYDETSAESGSATANPTKMLEVTPETLPETESPKSTPVETASSAVTRFKACRWNEIQENTAPYCANRDVLPFAGKNGFNPEAWCPDCTLYKVKRKVNKRSQDDWNDY